MMQRRAEDVPELVEEPEHLCGSECFQFEPLQLVNGSAAGRAARRFHLFSSKGMKGISEWMACF